MHTLRAAPINAEDRKVGPIPLPWFIPICIFTAFFITFILWFSYQHTVVSYQNKMAMLAQEGEGQELSRDVEMQVRDFFEAHGRNSGWRSTK
jgi:hypothetical protein